jgi:hypothetical protein
LLPLARYLDGLRQSNREVDRACTFGDPRSRCGPRYGIAPKHDRSTIHRRLPPFHLGASHEHSRRVFVRMSEHRSERHGGCIRSLIG